MYDELVKRLRLAKAVLSRNKDLIALLSEAADATEELQKALDAVNDAHNEGYDVGYWAGRRDYEPKWIPVTERLPEDTNPVIAFCNGKAGNVSFEDAEILAIYEESEGWWWDSYPEISHIPVTHWMPLPELPKEEEIHGD